MLCHLFSGLEHKTELRTPEMLGTATLHLLMFLL